MPDQPPLRRSVRDFCKHYGLTRNQFLIARDKARVMPKAYDSMLSVKDQDALLRHVSAEKRTAQVARRIWQQPTVTKRFVPPPKPSIDYDAEIERVAASLAKWRTALIEFAKGHAAVDAKGWCRRCHIEAPCPTKQTLTSLDNELVEHVAIADSGHHDEAANPDVTISEGGSERQLNQLRSARNRWMSGLTKLTIDHMLEDAKGRCSVCRVAAPCDTKKVVIRINKGIAHQIEKFASMDDRELEVALGNRQRIDYYEDDDWDAM